MDVTHEHRIGGALVLALVSLLVCLFCLQASPASADELSASKDLAATAATASTSSSASSASDFASSSSSSADESASSSASSSASASASSAPSTEDSSSSASSDANEEVATAALMATTANAPLTANVVAATAASTDGTVTIQYDDTTGIHYLNDSNSVNGRIILYCMNNEAEWPHWIPSAPNVPDYTLGYLTPDMFKEKYPENYEQKYQECLEKLLAILYAGYPYNGLHMYETGQAHNITEDEFNQKLDAPSVIRTDFPDTVGDTTFTYSDYTNNNTENLTKLQNFQLEVGKLFPNGKSASGLTYQQIVGTDFYQAAWDMYMGQQGSTPLEWWDATHGSDYYVDDSGAYWGTQYAIWVTLNQYGIPENDLTLDSSQVKNYPLAARLVQYADASAVLREEPQKANVSLTGDAQFSYDPASKTWRTGALSISEGTNYNGRYTLTLPDGVTVVDDDGAAISTTDVRAGRSFYLQSATKPTATVTVSASAALTWLKETRQYSPVKNPDGSEITITTTSGNDGQTVTKHYQHMIGALIEQKTVKASPLDVAPAKEGSLKLTKAVTGEQQSTASFEFTVKLTGEASGISGRYGDLTFDAGTAKVSLQAGQSATAEHLPAGVDYTVTEEKSEDYSTSSEGETGTIVDGGTATADFTNARLYKLTLAKTVSGQAADSSQDFTLDVTLKDSSGKALTGTYSYTGSTVAGSAAAAHADGTIALDVEGKGSVTLKPGQTVTIKGLPSGASYEVEEAASTATDKPLYDATYNGSSTPALGTLSADAAVTVNNAVQEGSLSVTKHVKGEVNSKQAFTFTVKLGGAGANLSGKYGDMEFANGQATFTLKDGETKTASALPAGATYEVVEESNDKYTTTSENDKGQIIKGGTAAVSFTNTRGTTSLPLSGQAGIGALFLAGAALLAIAAVRIHRRRARLATKGGDADER